MESSDTLIGDLFEVLRKNQSIPQNNHKHIRNK